MIFAWKSQVPSWVAVRNLFPSERVQGACPVPFSSIQTASAFGVRRAGGAPALMGVDAGPGALAAVGEASDPDGDIAGASAGSLSPAVHSGSLKTASPASNSPSLLVYSVSRSIVFTNNWATSSSLSAASMAVSRLLLPPWSWRRAKKDPRPSLGVGQPFRTAITENALASRRTKTLFAHPLGYAVI